MKRDKQEYAISEFILLICKVECDFCGAKDEIATLDVEGGCTAFYDLGWRVRDEVLLCKKCLRRKQ